MWSNYSPAGRLWHAAAFSVARGSIQKKSSNLKFVEKRVKLHLSHWIVCSAKCICTRTMNSRLPFLCTIIVFVLVICFKIKLEGTVLPNLTLGHLYGSPPCFFDASTFVVLNSFIVHLVQWTQYLQINPSIHPSAKRDLLKVFPQPN